jgi:hypothetical protein
VNEPTASPLDANPSRSTKLRPLDSDRKNASPSGGAGGQVTSFTDPHTLMRIKSLQMRAKVVVEGFYSGLHGWGRAVQIEAICFIATATSRFSKTTSPRLLQAFADPGLRYERTAARERPAPA